MRSSLARNPDSARMFDAEFIAAVPYPKPFFYPKPFLSTRPEIA
jgi:hypothetical protein